MEYEQLHKAISKLPETQKRRLLLYFFGELNFLLGMVLSYVLETPSGASVVVVDLVVFLLFCGVQRIQCRVKK